MLMFVQFDDFGSIDRNKIGVGDIPELISLCKGGGFSRFEVF